MATPDVPAEFADSVRDVLSHLYDHAYLVRHPFLRDLPRPVGAAPVSDPTEAVRSLRLLVVQAVETLRPRPETPASDPAWRPYSVVRSRYLLGKEFEEISSELSLGVRQVQRELRRGLAAVAQVLWAAKVAALATPELPPNAGGGSALQQEISRLATEVATTVPVPMQDLWESALAAVRPLAGRYDVHVAHGPACSHAVVGDAQLLRQLLIAALSFAIQAVPSGEVRTTVGADRSSVIVTLAATAGPAGPPQEHAGPLEALMVLATAQQAALHYQPDATGLVLRLQLPMAHPSEINVALIEDNHSVVALFSRYLSGHGYRVLPIEDAGAALTRLPELAPDIIILDVMMHGMDGWQVLQGLKADPGLRQIPVVVCSVLNDPELAFAIGAAAYLRKPVRPAQLLECLAQVLEDRATGRRR